MSAFECPNCQHITPIFSQHGAKKQAELLDIPFLGAIPLAMVLREGGDNGTPAVLNNEAIRQVYTAIAKKVIA
jgi:ATP-binding protein involved in chromosome partitioning